MLKCYIVCNQNFFENIIYINYLKLKILNTKFLQGKK